MSLHPFLRAGCVLAIFVLSCLPARAGAERFRFMAIGDMPYTLPADFAAFERLIRRINQIQPAFTVHVGDIKSGSTPCSDAHFARILAMFGGFDQPLVYTPGDNEWTDCHRPDNGPYDPLERLAKLREMFFASPATSLGRTKLPLEHQGADPKFSKFVENARWERGGVLFATAHVVGSNNNLQRDQAAVGEYVERNAANLAWLRSTFARATDRGAKAVVLFFQAQPWWELDGREDQRSGFTDTIAALKAGAIRFGRPVLIVQGDQHRLLIDQPLIGPGRVRISNATRVMVHGDKEVHGVLIHVDSDDPDVFSYRPIYVPENMPTFKPAPTP
jgi:hypothetical protein